MQKTVHFQVSGRVQGVFFRAMTREKAVALGVSGWVRNRRDGAVEGNATAEESLLEEFAAWLRHGPPQARVDRLEVRDIGLQSFSGFHIRESG